MNQFGKVAIALRSSQYDPGFFTSWTGLVSGGCLPGDQILSPAVRLAHSIAANFLLIQFLESDCDSILFLDDDHTFAPDSLAILRETEGFDAVSALTVTRRADFAPLVIRLKDDGRYVSVANPSGVMAVDMVGLAFTLIKRSAIEAVIKARGTREIFQFLNKVGEDGAFSQDLQSVGAKLAVNCNVNIGHSAAVTLWWNIKDKKTEMRFSGFGVGKSITSAVELQEE